MEHVVSHLVRRGVEAHASYLTTGNEDGSTPVFEMPVWGIVILVGTIISFVAMSFMVGYTYGDVIATLAMVESPSAAVYEPITNNNPDAPFNDQKNSTIVPELILVKQKPITAKLCTASRHLKACGGRLARFRGFTIYLVYHFALTRFAELLAGVSSIPLAGATVLSAVLLARLQTAWVHIVISGPSPKYWFKRLPSWKSWMKVALPTAVFAICQEITIALPVGLSVALGLGRITDPQQVADMCNKERMSLLIKGFVVVLLVIFCAIAIVVPAQVTLTRVQASLLSEEDEAIVPFDRTFGGRVVPEVVGGSGVISMLEAWKTFDWNSRVRLLKLYAKVILIQSALSVLAVVVILTELHFIMGEEASKYILAAKASMHS